MPFSAQTKIPQIQIISDTVGWSGPTLLDGRDLSFFNSNEVLPTQSGKLMVGSGREICADSLLYVSRKRADSRPDEP
jgi:hypothetical protein